MSINNLTLGESVIAFFESKENPSNKQGQEMVQDLLSRLEKNPELYASLSNDFVKYYDQKMDELLNKHSS